MHRHADQVLIRILQPGEQGVVERKPFLLLRSASLLRRADAPQGRKAVIMLGLTADPRWY